MNRTPMIQAWIDAYSKQHERWGPPHVDCKFCGWPHDKHLVCGGGATFGLVRLGGKDYSVDKSNVDVMVRFIEERPSGFHWRNDIYFEVVENGVRVHFIEDFNNHPHRKSWLIPRPEWESIAKYVNQAPVGEPVGKEQHSDWVNMLLEARYDKWVQAHGTEKWLLTPKRAYLAGFDEGARLVAYINRTTPVPEAGASGVRGGLTKFSALSELKTDEDLHEFARAWCEEEIADRARANQPSASSTGTEAADAAALLLKALARMDRARSVLTNGNPTPTCNWGMLDTSDLRAAMKSARPDEQPQS